MHEHLLPYHERLLRAEAKKAARDTSVPTERRKIAITDQEALLHLDIRDVLTDRVEVYDPRERPPREG
jgi:hypothetical protein